MKYILDFDRTLFDTDRFVEQLETDGVDYTCLVPEILADYVVEHFLYPDTVPFLQSKRQRDITILTALKTTVGDRIKEYQTAKVEQDPIRSLVGKMVYVEEEKGSAAASIAAQFAPTETIVFVDDLLTHCLSVQAALPQAHCFLLLRNLADSKPELAGTGVTLVRTLAEVESVMAQL